MNHEEFPLSRQVINTNRCTGNINQLVANVITSILDTEIRPWDKKKVGWISNFDDRKGRNAVKKRSRRNKVVRWMSNVFPSWKEDQGQSLPGSPSESQKLEQPCARIFFSSSQLCEPKREACFFFSFPLRISIVRRESLTPFSASRRDNSFVTHSSVVFGFVRIPLWHSLREIFREFNRFAVVRPALFRIS